MHERYTTPHYGSDLPDVGPRTKVARGRLEVPNRTYAVSKGVTMEVDTVPFDCKLFLRLSCISVFSILGVK